MNPLAVGVGFRTWIGLVAAAGLVSAVLHTSCTPPRTRAPASRDTTSLPTAPSPDQNLIPPNACRILATVVAIDTSLDRESLTDPCSKFYCKAAIRIDSVQGYGSAFVRPLNAGDVVPITFLYTLAPSRRAYPDMKPELPGLDRGDSFVADIDGGGVGIGGIALGFTVGTYALSK